MDTVRLIKNGSRQTLALPDEFQFEGDEVEILRRGKEVVLREKPRTLARAFELLVEMPIDVDAVMKGRDEPPQSREGL